MNELNAVQLQTCSLYAKYEGMKSFRAFDIENARFVNNVIYATMLMDTEDNKKKLKEIAEENKNISLVLQLRNNGLVVYSTSGT